MTEVEDGGFWALPLEPSDDAAIRIAQLENALAWTMDMLAELGVGYLPGDKLLAKRWSEARE